MNVWEEFWYGNLDPKLQEIIVDMIPDFRI